MARKIQVAANGKLLWATEQCEDKLLIAIYHEIVARIPPNQKWKQGFEDHFFTHGNSVAFDDIAAINAVRRRCVLPTLDLQETDIYEYGRLQDRIRKSELRRQLRSEFLDLDTVGRQKWKNAAEDQVAGLAPPHFSFEERREMHRYDSGTLLTPRELAMRAAAISNSTVSPPAPSGQDVKARAIKQLRLAQTLPDAEPMIQEIVVKLDPDAALDIAEDFDHPAIRAALIRQSFAA